jgi:hypothetical protein
VEGWNWKGGRVEGWKGGRVEGWKGGRVELEGWKGGRVELEGWKGGRVSVYAYHTHTGATWWCRESLLPDRVFAFLTQDPSSSLRG